MTEKKIIKTLKDADDRVTVVGITLTSLGYVIKYTLEGIRYTRTVATIYELNALYEEISKK